MVPRYSRPAMTAIWAPENRFRIWFEIEALAAEAMAQLGAIPAEAARTIRTRGDAKVAHITQADLDRIDAIEAETTLGTPLASPYLMRSWLKKS